MEFEWDDRKAETNLRKHGVPFNEAASVFHGPHRLFHDDWHSGAEDRYVAVGLSAVGRLLFVSHTYRAGRIRIIMARKATRRETVQYGKGQA